VDAVTPEEFMAELNECYSKELAGDRGGINVVE
jgi:hypothetical protein